MENNPWLTIWVKPKATIAKITAENSNRSLWTLAAIYGFCALMNIFQSMTLGASMPIWGILLLAVVLSPFWGYINFTVWSWFVTWVGKWFRGQGKFTAVRSAYAWSFVPLIVNVPLWLLMVGMFGHQLFVNFPDSHLLANSQVYLLFGILAVKVVLSIWSLVIYLNALAEVQKFSVLRAILNVVVAGVVVTIVFFAIWISLTYALSGRFPTAFMLWN